jgi:hypothetical protein
MHFLKRACPQIRRLVCKDYVQSYRACVFQRSNKSLLFCLANSDFFHFRINIRKTVQLLMQDIIMIHTANLSVAALEELFVEGLIINGLWPHRFLDMNLCDYCFGGHWKITFVWIIHILCQNWKIIVKETLLMFQNELHHMSRNIFRRCEACLEAGGNLNYRAKINSKLLLDKACYPVKVLCWGT